MCHLTKWHATLTYVHFRTSDSSVFSSSTSPRSNALNKQSILMKYRWLCCSGIAACHWNTASTCNVMHSCLQVVLTMRPDIARFECVQQTALSYQDERPFVFTFFCSSHTKLKLIWRNIHLAMSQNVSKGYVFSQQKIWLKAGRYSPTARFLIAQSGNFHLLRWQLNNIIWSSSR